MTLRNTTASSDRHGSTGTDSTRSTDTVRGPFGSFSTVKSQPLKLHTRREKLERQDSEVSPLTIPKPQPNNARANSIAPWETETPTSMSADQSGSIPAIRRQPPTAHPMAWSNSNENQGPMPQSIFGGSFYNDSNENLSQISPGFAPNNGMYFPNDGEDRRPSIASATTVSSTGSKSSVRDRMQKKLQGFFGETDVPVGSESRQNSEASSMQNGPLPPFAPGATSGRNRNNSMNDAMLRSGPPSPASRPRTPAQQPSSEVTPWVFQDAENAPPTPGSSFPPDSNGFRKASRLHLPGGHRHNRSTEEKGGYGFPLRPSTSREQSFSIMRGGSNAPNAMSSTLNLKSARSTSPAPSAHSAISGQAARSPQTSGHKRSLFDRVTGRHKGDKETLQSQSYTSLPGMQKVPTRERADSKAKVGKGKAEGTNGVAGIVQKKGHRLPFKSSKTAETSVEQARPIKDPNETHAEASNALWHLDTDMSHMEGIIDHKNPPVGSPHNEIYTGWPPEETPPEQPDEKGAWDAPDSWAVQKVADENMRRLTELDDEGDVRRDDSGPMFFMRIFRADSTFAVISASLNTTAAELISMMAKKTFLQDELDKYQIVMRKQDTSRQLGSGERPLVMQKRLLELVGYQDNDHLEDLGREDHGYLCRFTFLPAKMSGYSSLERDPGFNKMQRFNHIDLSGRNLITIPITLYQKSTEIITLNLSRNLTLDIPKDFVQSCTNLREIKYTSNEAWKVPPSLALAHKLTTLDVSNNRLDSLEHAELYKLQNLLSLKLSNNKLTTVPTYFGQYRALRSLNLSSNSLIEFPPALCELTTLVDLDISFNSISTLGDIHTLTNLERLWATNNRLSGPFDSSFSSLVNLREIDARFNNISNIDVVSQLPKLEALMLGHNGVSQFEGSFQCLKVLFLNHNPVTNFDLNAPVPSLSVLNLASAKLARLPDALFMKMSGLTKLTISKNHFVSLSPHFGLLSKLEYLSIAKNELSRLPAEIGRLTELRYLDVRENNLGLLPPEIWYAKRLETLNVSSNVLADFPKPGAPLPPLPDAAIAMTPSAMPAANSPEFEELGKLEDFQLRRPSQASGMMSTSSSPGTTSRKGSVVSAYSGKATLRRTSTASSTATLTAGAGGSRKDSTLSNRLAATFSSSLRHLFLADNRLEDDVFNELVLLPELRILNLSYNQLYDVPARTIRKWTHLTELYLSGNDLTSIPSEDLEEGSSLKVLHINNNKFQVLPAELGKIQRLAILDVGSNMLKYNVSNWPYDWNWNWNRQLRYLNLSGNKRLEIKPSAQSLSGRDQRDLTDFSSLVNLRILGLMDVTLTIPSVPDQAADRRVRLAGSIIGNTMPYGMADTLGRNEHLSTLDLVVPRFRGHEDEALVGLFDGQSLSSGGSKVAKFLHEKFKHYFIEELEKIDTEHETPLDALRRTYLGLNKELATTATQAMDAREHPSSALVHRGSISGPELGDDDITSGSTATVMYLHGMELYISNVGDAQCLLIRSEGGHRIITKKHDPAEASERQRIREAGGYVSRQGKLNDQLDVSRAFGFVQLAPCIIAAPAVNKIDIREQDEMILLASRELWDYLTPDFAVDVARQERGDLMRAAQKLRDLAIAFGATGKIMVMMVGVSDLRKREKARFRTHSMSMGPSGSPDDYFTTVRKAKRGRDAVGDSKLARLDQEVEPPTGDVTLVFTDIKNSTILWETYPIAMQSAIKMHNEAMRRHLRIIGGYEVKTEGDAFMVAFPTVTSALLWCFTIQSQLLEVQWPQEILNSVHGEEMQDAEGNVIFRGLSVRMGIHWGRPVCEIDPVTKRMDYFGPMVNRAARIESVADGGQICVSSDFIQEVQRMLESHIESDRSGSTGSDDNINDDVLTQTIRRELRSLSSQGFEVKDLGQRTLKGLENPEYIYLMYPHSLASRLVVQQQKAEAESRAAQENASEAKKTRNSQLTIDTDNVWDLWNVSLRLEMLCSSLESTGIRSLKPPETALLEKIKHGGGEITDRFLVNFVEHQISRIETCISTLALRNMIRPFKHGVLSQACPMSEILSELAGQLDELKAFKAAQGDLEMADA
ncbi:Putative ras-associating (RA) domain, adenylyl cyclase class-3/4/guanylyl cyclase [Septoria linicola]|uniref:Adenylate cyclase n=1 Tax=Septoria linicola TaxID=215465 RepID=A0A9Q9ENE6_9PEZI|nr:putative ras-associating (RA) domain, adenylyl cyclase class-3/4/guanylyl cyclase [Septoria linicola]USW56537.1 Putative ras-associating (RA) domain, adenylyl cyclase class-3/4/guanylyl cyclase [Septoria linicola]